MVQFLALDLLVVAIKMRFSKKVVQFPTLEKQISGTETNSPAHIYIYTHILHMSASTYIYIYAELQGIKIYTYIHTYMHTYIHILTETSKKLLGERERESENFTALPMA